jgi:hypothetical protein
MKRKQKSCQNEPSAGRFDGLPTRFDGSINHFNWVFDLKTIALWCLFILQRRRPDTSVWLLFPAVGKK